MSAVVRRGVWLDAAVLLLCAAWSSAWCLTSGRELSSTFDETPYVHMGLQSWRTGSHGPLIKLGAMPLSPDVQALPAYLAECWTGRPWHGAHDFNELQSWARASTLVFWWLLLFYGWLAARAAGGLWAGRLAVVLLSLEPNLLAHAGLVTADVPAAACTLALVYHFAVNRDCDWKRRVLLPGVLYGVAMTAKASALAFGPLCMLAVEAHRLSVLERPVPVGWRSRLAGWWSAWGLFRRDIVPIGLIGLVTVTLYCGCDWETEPSFVEWAQRLPDKTAAAAMTWVAENLAIFTNGPEGLVRQVKHNFKGHGTFLLGREYDKAVWYYFPVLFTIKLTVPMLAAVPALLALRARALWSWPASAAAVLFLFSLNCRVQIGIRFQLLAIALLTVAAAVALVRIASDGPGPWRRGLAKAAAALWLLHAAWTAGTTWPHALRYTNELWGGPAESYKLMSDSNYDWGQGLHELDAWRRERGLDDVALWYFGRDPMAYNMAARPTPLHVLPVANAADVHRHARGRYLAVGTSVLHGHASTPAHKIAAAYLRTLTPVSRTPTFLIFDFRDASDAGAHGSSSSPAPNPSPSTSAAS